MKQTTEQKYKEAIDHIEDAITLLQSVEGGWDQKGDANYFISKLQEILSSDHGECGMVPHLDFIAKGSKR